MLVKSATGRRLLASVPFVDGWPFALLLWHLAFGITLRTWHIFDATHDAPELSWVPKTIGVDAAFAIAAWLGAGFLLAMAKTRLSRCAARGACVALALLTLSISTASAVSFRISGSALTLQRLRGDDGATMRDAGLLEWADVSVIAALAALSLVALAVLLFRAQRLERLSRQVRALVVVVVVVVGAGAYGAYALAWQNQDHGYGRHPLGVLVDSCLQELRARPAELDAFVAPAPSAAGFRALMTPDHPTTPTPPTPTRAAATTKNVIVFFSEGVPLAHTSLAPNGPPTTPRLQARVARGGLVLPRFYSPYHRSIHALYSLLCGELPPPDAMGITQLNPRIDCGEFSTVFAQRGFKPALIHAGYFSFYDKGQFLSGRDYVLLEDATALASPQWVRNAWGIDDRAMVQRALQWIDSLAPEDRFALVLVPITAHYPFTVPADIESPFGTDRKIDRFWNSVHFLDIVFDSLMTGLEERGLLDDTLVLFTADHGESPLEPARVTNVDRAAYEYNVHVPAVMFSNSMFPAPQSTQRLGGIDDILPTLLDAAGVADSRERQGTSLLASEWQERRIFLGAARSNVNLLGFIDGHDKLLLNRDNGRMELYDLMTDPDELKDLSRRDPERMKRGRDTLLTYAQWQRARVRDWPALDQGPDVHDMLADDVDVTVIDGSGARTACVKAPDGPSSKRRCPPFADDFYPGNVAVRIDDHAARCLLVQAPPGGSVELTSVGGAFFPRLSMLQYATPDGQSSKRLRRFLAIEIDGTVVEDAGTGMYRRMPLPSPRERFAITVSAPEPVCLFFSVRAWAPSSD